MGGISGRSIEQRDHLREFVASGQLEEEIDVAAVVEWRLEELDIEMPPPKSRELASLYSISKVEAIAEAFYDDMLEHGYERGGIGFNTYSECPGHEWMTATEPEK